MVQWPPSPSVEDEHSALAKEHSVGSPPADLKSPDDQCIPSRGSVDQFPIILNSDSKDTPQTVNLSTSSATQRHLSGGLKISIPCTDDRRPPTPPPSDNETRGRSRVNDPRTTRVDTQSQSRSKSCGAMRDMNPSKTRPSIPRFQTAHTVDYDRVNADIGKDQLSPSSKPQRANLKVDSARPADVQYLSSACATSSPVSMHSPASHFESSCRRPDRDSSTESIRRPKKVTRFSDVLQGPGPSYGTPRGSSVPPSRLSEVCDAGSGKGHEQSPTEPRVGRRTEREPSRYEPQHVLQAKFEQPLKQPSRSSSTARASQTVSTVPIINSVPNQHRRDSVENSAQCAAQRLAEKLNKSNPINSDNVKQAYYAKDDHYSMTPPSVTTPKHMEDYFSQAFERNSQKSPRYNPRQSFDGSAYLSPPASPPRTPRGERSNRIYVESPATSPRRLSYQSRLPSWDENQYIELKASKTLLSQATTAATIAAKISPPDSRASFTTFEMIPNTPLHNPIPKSRSRPPSPDRESRSESARRRYPSLPPSNRSSIRDGSSRDEVLSRNTFQPTRAVSWSSHDTHHRTVDAQPKTSLHVKTGTPAPLPSPLHTAPPIFATQPEPQVDKKEVSRQFVLPRCPRPRPLPGLQDWSKIKGISRVRVCPTCAKAVNDTKYYKILERSHNDRDDEPITCGLSKGWMRVAFMQSLNRNMPDLKFVEEIASLSSRHQPCLGPEKDMRRWYRVKDPQFDSLVPNFYVCSTCVRAVDRIFPDLPNQFERDEKEIERVCNLQTGSRDFLALVEQIDLLAKAARERDQKRVVDANPFVKQAYRIGQRPVCAREKFVGNGMWHFMDDLPEFTVCGACFDEIVLPMDNRPIARAISRTPRLAFHVPLPGTVSPVTRNSNHPVSCQLYSEKMRRYFEDAADGMISYDKFKTKVRERFTTQWQLNQTSKRYEENQKTVESLKAEVDRKLRSWLMME